MAAEDTTVFTESSHGSDGAQSDGTTAVESDFFVSQYKDKVTAEEGIKEKDRYIEQLTAERDQASRKSSQLETEVLAELAKAQSRPSGPTQEQLAAQREAEVNHLVEDLASAFRDDDVKGSRKALQIMSSYAADVQDQAQRQLDKTKTELSEQFSKELDGVKNVLAERDPDVVQHGESARRLAESARLDFADPEIRKTLIGVVKAQQSTQHPSRPDLPGGAPSTRTIAAGSDSVLSETDRAAMASVGIIPTKEEEAALSRMAKYQR
jgi:hypothetical protein